MRRADKPEMDFVHSLRSLVATDRDGKPSCLALILKDVTPEGLAAVAERAVAALAAPIATPAGSVTIGASVGLAVAPDDGADMDALLQAADARMYRQKHARGDRAGG